MIPTNEQETIIKFVREMPEDWEIISFEPHGFPDAELKIANRIYKVEFELKASSFIYHQHDMTGCDFVICWEDDLGKSSPVPVISIQRPDWVSHPLLSDVNTLRAILELEKKKRNLLKRYVKDTQLQNKQLKSENKQLHIEHGQVRETLTIIAGLVETKLLDMPWDDLNVIGVEIAKALGGSEFVKPKRPGRPRLPLSTKILSEAMLAWITLLPSKKQPAYSPFSTKAGTSFPRGKEHLSAGKEILDYLRNEGACFSLEEISDGDF